MLTGSKNWFLFELLLNGALSPSPPPIDEVRVINAITQEERVINAITREERIT